MSFSGFVSVLEVVGAEEAVGRGIEARLSIRDVMNCRGVGTGEAIVVILPGLGMML